MDFNKHNINDNPFFHSFDTPYGVPPFHLIQDAHYIPAFEAAMTTHKLEIDQISNAPEVADFNNTIVALDSAGEALHRVSSVFFNLTSANTNASLEKISEDMAPILAKHFDYIALNKDLFVKVLQVWESKSDLNLDEEQTKLLEKTYQSFIRNGALLNDQDKNTITKINEELSVLTIKFGQNTLAEVNDFQLIIDDDIDLKGLPEDLKSAASEAASEANQEGKWLFSLQNPSVMPFLQYAESRPLRTKMWEALQQKCDQNDKNDNKDIVKKIVNLRTQRAQLLGYETHAHYVLEDQMAKTPTNVLQMLDQLWEPSIIKAQKEAEELQEYIYNEGSNFTLAPQDWMYYAEKIRKQKFDLDENEIKPYFSLDKVHQGVFGTVENLFGLTFHERKDLPIYHPEVKVYEVMDESSVLLGILYMDFHPRESKRGGAWMTSFKDQKMENGFRVIPVISIVCNFSKPSGNKPALLTFDEVSTYFHEFGHALHGLLSNVNYTTLSGTNVPTDFVELPSQIMENWAVEPEVLRNFAHHYETGATIPDALIEKITAAGTYGQGFATTEYLAAAILDMKFHSQTGPITESIGDFEKNEMDALGLIEQIIPRYKSTYFNHIFSGGYSAGYYSYIWSEVLDADAFATFKDKGIFDKKTAMSFRRNILEKGGTADPMDLYKRFKGSEPSINSLLKKRGLQ